MSYSQNLTFVGDEPGEPDPHAPRGERIAEFLHAAVRDAGRTVDEVDNWRDAGWSFVCTHDGAKIEVAVSSVEDSTWLLQLAPASAPGALARLMGKSASAEREHLFELAQLVHRALEGEARYSRLRWLWDGFPDDGNATLEPTAWDGSA